MALRKNLSEVNKDILTTAAGTGLGVLGAKVIEEGAKWGINKFSGPSQEELLMTASLNAMSNINAAAPPPSS